MTRKKRKKQLAYGVLEERKVLSANFVVDLADGVLSVHATDSSDTVRFVEHEDLILVGVTNNGQAYTVHEFDAADVESLYFSGKGGDDIFVNRTSLASTAYGNDGNDWLLGGSGDDVLRGGNGDDNIRGFDGDDSLHGDRGNDRLVGQNGNDRLLGWFGDDVLVGGAGDDYVSGYLGNDTLFAGDGDDILRGHEGDDFLAAGAGNDELYGWLGNDRLFGGDGDDYLSGYHGDDFISAGNGDDVAKGHLGNDRIFGGNGNDQLYGWFGDDRINGGEGDDELFGGDDNDVLYGWHGNDILHGDYGNDRLFGGRDNDVVIGYFGDDYVSGGHGADMLCGGYGRDTYVNVDAEDVAYDPDQDFFSQQGDDSREAEDSFRQLEEALRDFDRRADEVARIVNNVVDYDDSPLANDDTNAKLYFTDENSTLSSYDTTTGEYEVIGNHGLVLTDLAISADGELYAVSFTSLYRVDVETAAVEFVGNLGRGDINALTFTEDGRLLAAGFAGTGVYEVNTDSGSLSRIGFAGDRSAGDLSFHDGQLFLTSSGGLLITMDFDDNGNIASRTLVAQVDPLTYGLASLDNNFYGVVGSELYDVDHTDGTFSSIADFESFGAGQFYGMT